MIHASFDVADFIVLFYVLSVYPVMDVINILILILILNNKLVVASVHNFRVMLIFFDFILFVS